MDLQLYPLKYAVNYKDKSYLIEAFNYYSKVDEPVKWVVINQNEYLTNKYEFIESYKVEHTDITFDTKDEAVKALEIYLILEGKVQVYKDELYQIKADIKLNTIFNFDTIDDNYDKDWTEFITPNEVESLLIQKGITKFNINKSSTPLGGVQVITDYISDVLELDEVILEIEKEFGYRLINYFNFNCSHVSNIPPLYYYWKTGGQCTRWFTFIKQKY